METKRVSDQYKISAPSIILDGNLTVVGSTATVSSVNSTIEDNTIVLNNGEIGAGVTRGTSGIEVDRGSLDNSTFVFNEALDAWEIKIGSAYANIRGADPLNASDLVTKSYVDAGIVAGAPGGILTAIQFNNGVFGGSDQLVWNGSAVIVGQNMYLTAAAIGVTQTDSNLELSANGAGVLYFKSPVMFENTTVDPDSVAGNNVIYAKTPGNAGTGIYFTNTSATGELVSRQKAILFGLIF